MSRRLVLVLAIATGALLAPASAQAQWDPGASAMLGQGYGQSALAQSTMNNAFRSTRSGSGSSGGGGRRAEPAKPRTATARQLRTLRFTPRRAVSDAQAAELQRVLVASCPPDRGGCPTNHAELVALSLAGGQHRSDFRTNVRGLLRGSDRNVADGVTTFFVLAWSAQQKDLRLTSAQTAGARRVRDQLRNTMALDAKVRRLSATRKQQLVERLAAIAQHSLGIRAAYQQDPRDFDEQIDDVNRYLRDVAKELTSVDVRDLRLTRAGFRRR